MSVERMNALLEKLGSDHRVTPGEFMGDGMVKFCEALERHYLARIRAIEEELDHLRLWGSLPKKR